jgi:flagellar basal body-associated protein FliL
MAAAIPATVPAAPAPPPQGSGAIKIILIVVAVIIALGILGIGTLTFMIRRIAHHRQEGTDGNVRVETPFGGVQSTNNPDEAASNLGIDPYPGARVLNGNTVTVGGVHTVTAEFESDDAPQKVMAFYASQFPKATVSTRDQNRFSLVSNDNNKIVTINIEARDGKTRIAIADVSGKGLTGNNSSD